MRIDYDTTTNNNTLRKTFCLDSVLIFYLFTNLSKIVNYQKK